MEILDICEKENCNKPCGFVEKNDKKNIFQKEDIFFKRYWLFLFEGVLIKQRFV